MALTKPAIEILNVASLAAGTTTTASDCTVVIDATTASQVALEAFVTFDGSATGDCRIHMRCASTNSDTYFDQAVSYGADQDGYFDVPCSAGNTVIGTAPFDPSFKYGKAYAQNLDGSHAITRVIVNKIVQDVAPT